MIKVMPTLRLLVTLIFFVGGQADQQITLYTDANYRQRPFVVKEPYISQMINVDYNDIARSACLTGIWLLYEEPFYNFARKSLMQFHFGPDNYCVDLKELQIKVSSLRAVGNLRDYRQDTLTLYENPYFQGVEEFIFGNVRSVNLDKRASSLIVTGSSPWTLYDGPNFKDFGKSKCVYPPRSNNYSPGFVADTRNKNLEMPDKLIRSVRIGCHTTRKSYITKIAPLEGQSGSGIFNLTRN